MRKETYNTEIVKQFFTANKIATMDQLKKVLGTDTNMTVIRKLKGLKYHSSYSHRGKYYTLESIAEFDDTGLWSFGEAMFSRYGTLVNTVRAFVEKSEDGLSAGELRRLLGADAKESLLNLFRKQEVKRKKFFGKYVWFSSDSKQGKRQTLLRKDRAEESVLHPDVGGSNLSAHELKAAILLFYAFLDEKQRRLYAGLESLKIGFGGDKTIAELLGIDPHTVARGRRELQNCDIVIDRIRKKGAGRISTEKKSRKS